MTSPPGPADREAPGSLSLVVRRVIRAPPARVFEAWTRPEELEAWWGPPGVRCESAEVDLRPGGSYRIENRLADGRRLSIRGTFESVEPPWRLSYSWQVVGSAAAARERVSVRFEPCDGGTEVIVVHERIAEAKVRQSHLEGWRGCLDGLDRHLAPAR